MKKINALYFQSRWKKLVGQTLLHLTMAILLFCMIYPLAMSVWCAFKTTAEYDLSKFYPTLADENFQPRHRVFQSGRVYV